ncbi:tetrahydromethanopterin S-methyltransferase subunit A [Paenibacillus endophyticus]|uniref:Tetrahydromethanopterin S-methyltransferase subunit A n=1 Tax=Paenibacillus endophyticus TaxID=1294268 RepID=A0A7W5CD77_9BACL|nr:hypothetical protein [Paenibacillus endophyticus]MBB3155040.1 tetrahydromethanopterin S-methyltransferase subunit A [Paenibacillus endophyticus]
MKVEQEIESESEVGGISNTGGNNNADNSIPKVEKIHNNASYVQKKVSELSSNVQFEKTEGIKDKIQKHINKNPFIRDYNGQKKKSRRTLK